MHLAALVPMRHAPVPLRCVRPRQQLLVRVSLLEMLMGGGIRTSGMLTHEGCMRLACAGDTCAP